MAAPPPPPRPHSPPAPPTLVDLTFWPWLLAPGTDPFPGLQILALAPDPDPPPLQPGKRRSITPPSQDTLPGKIMVLASQGGGGAKGTNATSVLRPQPRKS